MFTASEQMEFLKQEERSGGRKISVAGLQTINVENDSLMVVVFEPEPTEVDGTLYFDRRWAVLTRDSNGKDSRTGGIISQWTETA
jgi:hypothetical protein